MIGVTRDDITTPCEKCGHAYGLHSIAQQRCKHYKVVPHPKGYKFGNAKFIHCKCKTFVDKSERLALT